MEYDVDKLKATPPIARVPYYWVMTLACKSNPEALNEVVRITNSIGCNLKGTELFELMRMYPGANYCFYYEPSFDDLDFFLARLEMLRDIVNPTIFMHYEGNEATPEKCNAYYYIASAVFKRFKFCWYDGPNITTLSPHGHTTKSTIPEGTFAAADCYSMYHRHPTLQRAVFDYNNSVRSQIPWYSIGTYVDDANQDDINFNVTYKMKEVRPPIVEARCGWLMRNLIGRSNIIGVHIHRLFNVADENLWVDFLYNHSKGFNGQVPR